MNNKTNAKDPAKNKLKLRPGNLSYDDLHTIWHNPVEVSLEASAYKNIRTSSSAIENIIAKGDSAYGINTGFGLLAKTRIEDSQLKALQKNLILSHSVGVGEPLKAPVVRLILCMKIASLARGFSGIRAEVIDTMIAMLNADILPYIPEKGSVGASGDLAPLSHMTLAMMGEGKVIVNGKIQPAKTALKKASITPVELAAKEGLALINGTQVSTALALEALFQAQTLLIATTVIGALSVDAAKGSDTPFDTRIHEVRGHKAQTLAAQTFRQLLKGSKIRASHIKNDDRVQDPYSLRCQPQVVGACLTVWRQAADTLLTEANAVTDNPLVFPCDNDVSCDVLSGGNFHAEPVAFCADMLALIIAEIGSMSERRMALLIDATLSGLPPFLVENAGLNSGFMIAHVTAAALASENKSMAHPASVDSLPTSANQEDHVSMATFAGRRLIPMAENTCHIIAIEWLAAAQGIDFHNKFSEKGLKTSAALQKAHELLRTEVMFYDKDRMIAPDIEAAKDLISGHHFNKMYEKEFKNGFCLQALNQLPETVLSSINKKLPDITGKEMQHSNEKHNTPVVADTIWTNARIATMQDGKYSIIENGALAVSGEIIQWLGKADEIPQNLSTKQTVDVNNQWIVPGLLDCHTHVVYGGNRSNEFEARLNGTPYTEIAKQGGGILSSVRSTREQDEATLLKNCLPRVRALLSEGVSTIEVKSGYGLNLEAERKMLKVARQIEAHLPVTIKTTFLGAHATPPEFKNDSDGYIQYIIEEMMPALHAENLIDCVDGFCESIAFSREQMARVFDAAKALGLPVKLHAEQLTNQEGASLVAEYQGLSADHIEYLSDKGIAAMKLSDTVGVLLPGAFYMLNETQKPPVQAMRDAGVKMAVATDCNPGTSPMTSLLLAMNMACILFKLTPEEALAGTTTYAAKALGIDNAGELKAGNLANFAVYDIDRPADLSYMVGFNPLQTLVFKGQAVSV